MKRAAHLGIIFLTLSGCKEQNAPQNAAAINSTALISPLQVEVRVKNHLFTEFKSVDFSDVLTVNRELSSLRYSVIFGTAQINTDRRASLVPKHPGTVLVKVEDKNGQIAYAEFNFFEKLRFSDGDNVTFEDNKILVNKKSQQKFGVLGGVAPYTYSLSANAVSTIDAQTGLLTAANQSETVHVVVVDSIGNRLDSTAIIVEEIPGHPDKAFGDSGFIAVRSGVRRIAASPDESRIYTATEESIGFRDERTLIAIRQIDAATGASLPFKDSAEIDLQQFGSSFSICDIAVDAKGRILVLAEEVGLSKNDEGHNEIAMVLYRFLPDGTVDASFGKDGKARSNMYAQATIHLQSDGKIVLAGSFFFRGKENTVFSPGLRRFQEDGSIDINFGVNGDSFPLQSENMHGMAVALVETSRSRMYLVSGQAQVQKKDYVAVSRVLDNGKVDPDFGSQGIKTIDIAHVPFDDQYFAFFDSGPNTDQRGTTIASLADGTIIVGAICSDTPFILTLDEQAKKKTKIRHFAAMSNRARVASLSFTAFDPSNHDFLTALVGLTLGDTAPIDLMRISPNESSSHGLNTERRNGNNFVANLNNISILKDGYSLPLSEHLSHDFSSMLLLKKTGRVLFAFSSGLAAVWAPLPETR